MKKPGHRNREFGPGTIFGFGALISASVDPERIEKLISAEHLFADFSDSEFG